MFGVVTGPTTENTGLLGLTRVGSRRVIIDISAAYMLFFSILGKFGAVLASIPLPIFAALYCLLFAYVVSAGLGFLQFCNLNSFRTKFILGFSLFLGLSIPHYFYENFVFQATAPSLLTPDGYICQSPILSRQLLLVKNLCNCHLYTTMLPQPTTSQISLRLYTYVCKPRTIFVLFVNYIYKPRTVYVTN